MNTVILLFALFTNPDGTKDVPSDIAVFADRAACDVVAKVLNESPKKPSNLEFKCREGVLPVKS